MDILHEKPCAQKIFFMVYKLIDLEKHIFLFPGIKKIIMSILILSATIRMFLVLSINFVAFKKILQS